MNPNVNALVEGKVYRKRHETVVLRQNKGFLYIFSSSNEAMNFYGLFPNVDHHWGLVVHEEV